MNKFFKELKKSKFYGLSMLFISILMTFSSVVYAQQVTVTGTVSDQDGTLPGVTIVQDGTQHGTSSDINGNFSITVPMGATLNFTMVGFTTQHVVVTNAGPLNIIMSEGAEVIDELVVVGYGQQRRSEVTASVATLGEDQFSSTVATQDAMELARGRIPGLVIVNATGDPRSGSQVQIRGTGTTRGRTGPLYVIDGIPGGNIDLIAPEDIESLSVLKDAAAAAIYGTRGSNGVILVTTKRGRRNQDLRTTFEYSGTMSKQYIYKKPEVLTADEFRNWKAINGTNSDAIIDYGGNTDWLDLLTNKDNYGMTHNLAMAGGSRTTNYRASIFYRGFEAISMASENTNYGGRINLNHMGLNDKLDVQFNLSASFRNRNELGTNDMWEQALQRNPTGDAKDAEGNWIEDGAFNSTNPLRYYSTHEDYSIRNTIMTSARATYTIIDGLKASMMVSLQDWKQIRNEYRQRDSKSSMDSYAGGGYARKRYSSSRQETIEFMLDYSKYFVTSGGSTHSFNVIAGHSYEYEVDESFGALNSRFATDLYKYNNLVIGAGRAQATSQMDIESSKADVKLASFFGSVNYSLNSKYLLSATLRTDGSSRFGPEARWGVFPAASLGWIMTSEDFMQGISQLDELKLRVSYGLTGNIPDANFLYMATMNDTDAYPMQDGTYIRTMQPNRNPNFNLQWEEKREFNLGVDYSLYNSRFTGSIEYFYRVTSNLIDEYNAQLPASILATIWTNVGKISNRGIEFGLSARVINQGPIRYNVDVNFTHIKNRLESFANDTYKVSYREFYGLPSPGALGNAIRTEEGGSLSSFYGKRFAGFDDQGKWLFYDKDNNVIPLGEVKNEDLTYIGNGTPKYWASLNNTFRYGNLDLSIFLRGTFGFDILNLPEMYFGNHRWFPNNVLKSAITKHAKMDDNPQYCDYYIEKGGFVKLDNVSLGYNFNVRNSQWVNRFRVYVSGSNLLTITNYTGTNPELRDRGTSPGMQSGIDIRGIFPATSSIMFGVNLGF